MLYIYLDLYVLLNESCIYLSVMMLDSLVFFHKGSSLFPAFFSSTSSLLPFPSSFSHAVSFFPLFLLPVSFFLFLFS